MSTLPATKTATLLPAIERALADYAHAAAGAFSPNTERALRADTALFLAWCRESSMAALPATSGTLVAFIDAMAAARAPASIRRYVSSIATMHRAAQVGDPTKAPSVRFALKRMHRAKGRRQQQAQALTLELRNRMIDAAGDSLIDRRNRALVAVAYDTACRRSELVALQVRDIRSADDGSGAVLVRKSKTDSEGHGQWRYLAPDTMALIREWIDAATIVDGPVFRAVNRGGNVGAVLGRAGAADAGGEVARIFKRMAKAAKIKPSIAHGLSGHSARVGAAQDMAAAGIELPAIMQAGGWKSPEMVARYTERLTAKRGAAAKLAALQNRV